MSDQYYNFKGEIPHYADESLEQFELFKLRHSCEHVLMQAMQNIYGKDAFYMAMGPAIADGFYFDFDPLNLQISEADLPKIAEEMQKIVNSSLPITRIEVNLPEARNMFKDNAYKQEWLDEIETSGGKVTVYKTGEDFIDLCKGPHVDNTKEIGPFKLLKIAGAYWHGDEKNKMLVRIYGTAFKTQEELDQYLWQREEAKKRDHRKLGKQLDLFTFSDLVGSGMPLYTPNGALIRKLLNEYVEELQSGQGYTQVWTPQIAKAELFKISGHYEKYKDDMFRVHSNYSGEEFYLKPMNCPQHIQIYASRPRSYKELPLRYTDFAMLYRDERPGELLGLARVRSFSVDDCHIFCREDQVDAEIDVALAMTKKIMDTFGFAYKYRLSTRDPQHPEKYLGDPKVWDKVEAWAVKIMQRNNIPYFDGLGEAAFYAPKMDLIATDSLGREWQLSTVQIDYVMPSRFKLTYIDKSGKEAPVVMIHRAILGSSERFLMVLLESYAGALPAWLSPEQVRIIPISDQNISYAEKVKAELDKNGIRCKIDSVKERMQNKIRQAQELKIPYMLILGKQEESNNTVSLRYRDGNEAKDLNFEEFKAALIKQINQKNLDIKLL